MSDLPESGRPHESNSHSEVPPSVPVPPRVNCVHPASARRRWRRAVAGGPEWRGGDSTAATSRVPRALRRQGAGARSGTRTGPRRSARRCGSASEDGTPGLRPGARPRRLQVSSFPAAATRPVRGAVSRDRHPGGEGGRVPAPRTMAPCGCGDGTAARAVTDGAGGYLGATFSRASANLPASAYRSPTGRDSAFSITCHTFLGTSGTSSGSGRISPSSTMGMGPMRRVSGV